MERMLDAIGYSWDDVVCITDENLPDVVDELQHLWPPETVPPGYIRTHMRPLVFTIQNLGGKRPDLAPLLKRCPKGTPLSYLKDILGHVPTVYDMRTRQRDQEISEVCWPTYNLGTMHGCPHGCLYCEAGKNGKFIAIALNLEDYIERVVGPTIEKYQWSKVFRMYGWGSADHIAFEPEYGVFDLFMRKLAQYENRYGYFHTASANVDWISDLPHRDRLIGVWSVTCETIARDMEPGAGSAIDRIEAGRKCQEMGIPVRYKFKPVIPVRNWREEYSHMIEQALKRSNPESIGFTVIKTTHDALVNMISPDLLDVECLEAAREAVEEMKGVRKGPFPHHVRAEIHRFLIHEIRHWDKDVLLYICAESREMWDELKDELGQDPRAYFCGCGSVSAPGRRLLLSSELRYSTYSPAPS